MKVSTLCMFLMVLFWFTVLRAQINPNPGFEEGTPGVHVDAEIPGWVLSPGTGDALYEITDDPNYIYSGNQALMVTVNAIGANAWEPQVFNTEFPVTSNTTYTISAWAKTDVAGVMAHFTAGSLDPNYHEWGRMHGVVLDVEWQQITFDITTRDPEPEPRGGVPIHFGLPENTGAIPFTIWLDDVEVKVAGGVGVDNTVEMPKSFALQQNYPNPFNPSTTISFTLPQRSDIRLQLINILGNVVKEAAAGSYEAGEHHIKVDASDLTSGIYFYRLEAGSFVSTKKLTLLK